MHPTKQILLDVAVSLLSEKSGDQITADEILSKSSVSKGSLYHHFVDLNDLIESAQIERVTVFVRNIILGLSQVLQGTEDFRVARERFYAIAGYRESDGAREMRAERMKVVVMAAQSSRFRDKYVEMQTTHTAAWSNLYSDAVARGWANPDLDPHAVSILMQSTIAGRIVDDIGSVQMEHQNWVKVIQYLLDRIFFANCA